MAAKCPISLRQFERFSSKHFNKTPKRWVKQLQLEVARDLIAQGWKNKAVAEEIGMTPSTLCKAFKKLHGAPPQSFAPLYGKIKANGSESSHDAVEMGLCRSAL